MKIKPCKNDSGEILGWMFYCPGCQHMHVYHVAGNLVWSFNGDVVSPTFAPSLLNTCETHPVPSQRRCHLNLTDGRLQFHPDCSHALAGKLVDLPELSDLYDREDSP